MPFGLRRVRLHQNDISDERAAIQAQAAVGWQR